MKKLILKQQKDKPAIILLPAKGKFQIVGKCYPENPKEFFKPILNWFEEYFDNDPLPETTVEIIMTFFNTSCLIALRQLVILLLEKGKQHNVKILWYYYPVDDEILDEGKRFKFLLNNPKNFILVELKDDKKIDLLP